MYSEAGDTEVVVYNLFIIWNVNVSEGEWPEESGVVYNLFIIWNVNSSGSTIILGKKPFIICSLYEM